MDGAEVGGEEFWTEVFAVCPNHFDGHVGFVHTVDVDGGESLGGSIHLVFVGSATEGAVVEEEDVAVGEEFCVVLTILPEEVVTNGGETFVF